MIEAVKLIDSHQYECIDNKIGYLYYDSISFDISYGYLTSFAYVKEH